MDNLLIFYIFMVISFLIGWTLGAIGADKKPKYEAGFGQLMYQNKNVIDEHPKTLDDLIPEEKPKPPIVAVKLGGVKRPTAEELWAKHHPKEAAEREEMRKGLAEIVKDPE